MVAGPDATLEDIALIRAELGLDRPLWVQYVSWIGDLLRGDLGTSTRTYNPVSYEVGLRIPATLELTAISIVIAVIVGLAAGVIAAIRRNSWIDYTSMVVALLGICTPSCWLGLMLMLVFAVWLGWFPTSGRGSWEHLILPGITLWVGSAAIIARVTRSSMLEVLNQDYIERRRPGLSGTRHDSGPRHEEHADSGGDYHWTSVRLSSCGAVITESVFAYWAWAASW